MLLTYGGSQAARFKEAQDKGLIVHLIRTEWVLTLDIDNAMSMKDMFLMPYLFNHGRGLFRPEPPLITRSHSGTNYHVYVPLAEKLSPIQYWTQAMFLGSDPKREQICYDRVVNALDPEYGTPLPVNADGYHSYAMFETPEWSDRVIEWHHYLGLYCITVGEIDLSLNAYAINRHFPRIKPKKGLESLYGQPCIDSDVAF